MKIPFEVYIMFAACLLCTILGGAGGYHIHTLQDTAATLKAAHAAAVQAQKVNTQNLQASDINNHAATASQAQQEKTANATAQIVYRTRTVITPSDDRACVVSRDAASVFNAATTGNVSDLPPATGKPQAEPSTVHLSDIATAYAADLGYCRAELGKYQSLWDDWNAQADLAGTPK